MNLATTSPMTATAVLGIAGVVLVLFGIAVLKLVGARKSPSRRSERRHWATDW
jgi:hypothetical protein